jgi:transposase
MARMKRPEGRLNALRAHGTVNPHPQAVSDPLFQEQSFFDPRDLMQVKYEMLRRVRREGASVQAAAKAFGFSRVAWYEAGRRFEAEGLAGLLPKRRGPKGGHKLSGEVAAFLAKVRSEEEALSAATLVERLKERFGMTVHRRSIERLLARQEKKRLR